MYLLHPEIVALLKQQGLQEKFERLLKERRDSFLTKQNYITLFDEGFGPYYSLVAFNFRRMPTIENLKFFVDEIPRISGLNISSQKLKNVWFGGVQLPNLTISESQLDKWRLKANAISRFLMVSSLLREFTIEDQVLETAGLWNVKFELCEFKNVTFNNCKFNSVEFARCQFEDCTFNNCTFLNTEISHCVFNNTQMKRIKFTGLTLFDQIKNKPVFIDCFFEQVFARDAGELSYRSLVHDL